MSRMLRGRFCIRGRICKRGCSRAACFCGWFANPGSFGRECGQGHIRRRSGGWRRGQARVPPGWARPGAFTQVCIAISGPGSVGFSGVTVRPGICLFCRSDIAGVLGCAGLCRIESPDCVCWWRFCWSRTGQGFWCGMASVQRFCEEGGRWVTFLCEKIDGVSGV